MIDRDNLAEFQKWVAATANLVSTVRSKPQTAKLLQSLANNYRERITKERKTSSATRWWRTKWRPKKNFNQLPQSSQQKALKVKTVVSSFYMAIEKGLSSGHAEQVAGLAWSLLFGKPISLRHLRRIITRVEDCGGPESAPNEAYADQRSVPHRKKEKQIK
jgi:hypothetical protein